MISSLRMLLLASVLWLGSAGQPVDAQTPSYRTPSPTRHRHIPHPARSRNGSAQFYKNSLGERVQSPTFYAAPPAAATAECRDGTYSFSRSRRGTCSHHGGVKRWLRSN
ncbi:DUF3761 domain-containing protein [Spirosoma rigui]|uniref:DUF3761 domain-containing protein n=1 Tax=Spirosoma rigui TaxID=564064 RepID=UPI001C54D0C7|nr:DUF3761 domain-containing protein [Spirosoma rigui]